MIITHPKLIATPYTWCYFRVFEQVSIGRMAEEEEASFTLSQEELYRLGLSFYKEQEAKGLQVVNLF